ncbi:MAG: MBOAT family O-acyltransferase [Gammaproteobacteria bacterium]|jgi:alginate O-acetyltransferase complex protein AlgI
MPSFSLLSPLLYGALLPALVFYWLVLKADRRPLFLTLFSCLFLATASPVFFLYTVAVTWIISRLKPGESQLGTIVIGIGVGVVTIFCWKYIVGFYLDSALAFSDFRVLFSLFGVSYMALRIVSLLISVRNGETGQTSFLECLNFLCFFPTLAAGPLESIRGFREGYSKRFDRDLFRRSIYLILLGLFKKLVVVNALYAEFFGSEVSQFIAAHGPPAEAYSAFEIFLLSMLLFLKAFLDISAYTDLALGFAGLFGYRIINDVRYPLVSLDLSDFWRRWHVSVMRWCQTHIYFPVYFWRRNMTLATFSSLVVMGIWHQVELKWLCWGLYQAAGLTILQYWNRFKAYYRYPASDTLKRLHAVNGSIITFLFASMAFLFMGPETFSRSMQLFSVFFGF